MEPWRVACSNLTKSQRRFDRRMGLERPRVIFYCGDLFDVPPAARDEASSERWVVTPYTNGILEIWPHTCPSLP